MKNFLRLLILLHICIGAVGCAPEEEYMFPGVEGPNDQSVVVPFHETSFEKYGTGTSSRLAVLVNAEPVNWLSLAHALKTIGIPFVVTQNPDDAIKHKVVLAYPEMSTRNWSKDILAKLRKFVFHGGTLIASPATTALEDVFGFQNANLGLAHTAIFLNSDAAINHIFTEPEERSMQLSQPTSSAMSTIRMWSYMPKTAEILATYENNNAAIILNSYGKGRALSFGLDLGELLTNSYAYGANQWGARYANHFIPTADVFLRMIKEMYVIGEPDAVTIGTVPYDKSLAVMFTHDVTGLESVNNILSYAEFEAAHNIPSTYFMVTKYMSDYNESYFFDAHAAEILTKAALMGMEIASHSVSHSRQFYKMPVGTGWEKYPTYRPMIMNRRVTLRGSVMGELRVSKFLLETLADHAHVTSFRAGYLLVPRNLPQVLEGTGYLYCSSSDANDAWTHLPFQLNYCYESAAEVNIFEFPITLEDIAMPEMIDRLDEGIAVAKKIARYGGICVILIHPDFVGTRFEFEEKFIDAVKDFSWFGTLQAYGNWWAARNEIEVDVTSSGEKKTVSVAMPRDIKGMNLILPEHWKFEKAVPVNSTIFQKDRKLIIEEPSPMMKLIFSTRE